MRIKDIVKEMVIVHIHQFIKFITLFRMKKNYDRRTDKSNTHKELPEKSGILPRKGILRLWNVQEPVQG